MNSQTISVSKLNAVSKGDREYSFFALSSKFSSAYIFVITEGENDSIALLQSENTAAESLFATATISSRVTARMRSRQSSKDRSKPTKDLP